LHRQFHHARWHGYGGPRWWTEEPDDRSEDLRDYVAGLEAIVKDLQAEISELKTRL
jgi:hypothetical protein